MKRIASALAIACGIGAGIAAAAPTDIASVPVMNITGTGSIKPNIMFMLDDSGSMGWDYTPDYVNDSGKCVDSSTCAIGKPPYMSPDFNYQYYNPDVTYSPGVNSSGTSYGAQTTFTAVKTDPYGVQQTNQSGSSMSTENLITNYPDLVYCSSSYSSSADLTNTAICRKNSAYSYPEPTGATFTSQKSIKGAPYYYRIQTTKYCSDSNLTTCIGATSPTGAYIYPAPVRWCTSTTSNYAYTSCQKNYDTSHTTPEFIGTVKPASPSAAAYGVVSVVTATSQHSITDMKVDGVSIISGTVSGTTPANFATALAQAINSSSFHSVPEYGACVGARNGDNTCSGTPNTTVSIFPQTAACGTGGTTISGCTAAIGTANNGRVITYSGPNIPSVAATGTVTVDTGPAGNATYNLSAVNVGAASINTGAITYTGDLSTAAGRQGAAAAIAARIGAGYTATASSGVVTITATTGGAAGNGALGVTSGATSAQATITVGAIAQNTTYDLAGIKSGGTSGTSIAGAITGSSSSSTASTRRQAIATAIANAITLGGYSASASSGIVTISAPLGASYNGLALSLTAPSAGTRATGSFTVDAQSAGSQSYTVTSMSTTSATISTGAATFTADLSTAAGQQTAAAAIAARIGNGYSATAANGVVSITADAAGTASNGALSYVAAAGAQANGSMSVSTGANSNTTYQISSITAGGYTISTGAFSFTANLSTAAGKQTAASSIATNLGQGSTAASGIVSIKAPVGRVYNGAVAVTGGAVAAGTAQLKIGTNSNTSTTYNIAQILMGTTIIASNVACTGGTSSTVATCVTSAINNAGTGFTATRSTSTITITANNYGTYGNGTLAITPAVTNPMAMASGYPTGSLAGGTNNFVVSAVTLTGGTNTVTLSASGMSGGVNAANAIPVTATTDFSGGTDAVPTTVSGMSGGADGSMTAALGLTNFANGVDGTAVPTRMNVGTFVRTDIAACPGGASDPCYPKAEARTDCLAASGCTYNEEMINFSNWYAYYRTRMQTMKSAASLAFSPLGANYRVGFSKLSEVGYAGGISMTPTDFNASARSTWYDFLKNANPGSSTPLRTALDNIGKMYANQSPYNYSGSARVVQYPCQQNFVILTTDGLWNQTYSGSVGNNDNVENASRFCTRANGCLDGVTSSPMTPSLADIALYWYNGGSNSSTVSLRPDLEPSMSGAGVVPAGPSDPNTHLHMTTFTLGLGVSGFMNYEPNYDTAPLQGGDYYKLITGAGGCPWNGGGTYTWPNPASDSLQAVDDLWHAAVNGHGKYFSARSPAAVVSGLAAAIAAMAVRTGAASAAATSTPNVSQQDNDIFSATFTTVKWYGELFDQKIDPATGNVSSTIYWSSSNTLGTQVAAAADSRTIKMLDTSGSAALKDFSYANMTATEKSWFDNKASMMVQYVAMTAAQRALALDGNNLVNWFRGQTQHADDTIFRAFVSTSGGTPIVLGDIDTAKPAYLRDPRKSYTGTYLSFKTDQAARPATVFAAANDGMLHAFNASDGSERWAYAPRITMSKLWRQAATDYGSNHQFTTDGSPEIADVQIGGSWKTVLVAGLNAGGRGYYALDVTDPTAPVALWEFCADSAICSKTDPDMGLTFGNPQFGYWNNKWVVLVTSGYNNIPGTDGISSGNGGGYLYVLDVATGTILKKIATAVSGVNVGDATTPSGLAKISAITNNPQTDPNITYVYGGDNLGNLWRFDFTDSTFTTIPVVKLAALGTGQPITARPDVALCQAGTGLARMVLLGTGRLLGVSDTTSTGTQSIYLVKDTGTALGNLNGLSSMVKQTLAALPGGTTYTLSSPQPVNLATKNGWYADLTLNSGERVNLDPKVVFSTAVVVSNLPTSASACTVGGTSYNYQFNLCTGSFVDPTSNSIGGVLSNTSAAVGFIVVKLPSGTVKMITTTADGGKLTGSVKASATLPARRTGWRSARN